ncbi:hypothetical protein CVT26_013120 [Gymnopilus dilepis]|uniref:Uncharacterized protein n=1 Tax=Gymnopilus dilepis TaxID=231916 RepID=A0A409YF51_9AGAR|nr:hypothetical protein CVT26_013120 [Gymnopilus dilepis]
MPGASKRIQKFLEDASIIGHVVAVAIESLGLDENHFETKSARGVHTLDEKKLTYERWVPAVLDDLARLAVQNPTGDVISTGFELYEDENQQPCLNLLICGNRTESISSMTVEHLLDVWSTLSDLSTVVEEDIQEKAFALAVKIHAYSRHKNAARLRKNYDRLPQALKVFSSKKSSVSSTRSTEQTSSLHDDIAILAQELKACSTDLALFCTNQLSDERWINTVRRMKIFYDKVTSILASTNSITRLEKLAEEMNVKDHWVLQRILEKSSSIQRTITQLTNFARSEISGQLFSRKFAVVPLDAGMFAQRVKTSRPNTKEWREIAQHLGIDGSMLTDDFVESLSRRFVPKKFTVHCEVTMDLRLRQIASEGRSRVEPYIGVSKLSCLLCHAWLDRDRISSSNNPSLSAFKTKGSHSKAYLGWKCPLHATPRSGRLRFLEDLRVLLGERLVNDTSFKYRRPYSTSDSTVSSPPAIRDERETDQIPEETLVNRLEAEQQSSSNASRTQSDKCSAPRRLQREPENNQDGFILARRGKHK